MAQNAPSSIDVQEIQFKLHRKLNVFKPQDEIKSLVHLLAVAPSKGLLFAANPYELEFKVFKLSELNTEGSEEIKVRAVPLISQTLALACSCDGSMLAVSYVFNKTGFLQIFQVDSFLSPDVNALYTMPIAPEYNVYTSQLLWNPVISNNLALIPTDGSVGMFVLNAGGQYDKITLNKEHQVKCGCWSPKGKQIVLGLGTGNLQQFKPNLTPARIIHSPVGLQQQPYDIIAVHWLSTFQFAAILVSKNNETLPCLYIVNAPKTGQPIFINYYDICYSGPGPRQQQFTFTHILSWNLLLVTSANGVEVGVLGTKETGENPTWLQYTLLDEARIEMPLTDAKDETYPMGFALDTSCSHQLILGEKKLPVMPIIHVLTTYGQLISFNFLNLMSGAQNICSPPPPIMDVSGQFMNLAPATSGEVVASVAGNLTAVSTASHQGGAGLKDATFTMHSSNMVTSTPAPKEKNNALFNNNNNTANMPVKPSVAATAVTETTTTTSTIFNMPGNTALTVPSKPTGFASKSATTANIFSENASNSNTLNIAKSLAVATSSIGVADSKPLYTVPSTYMPPTPPLTRDQQHKVSTTEAETGNVQMAADQTPLDACQVDEIVKRMLKLQIEAFDRELKQLRNQSDTMINDLGNRDEVKGCTKQLNDLHEIIDQANDHEFETDLQVLRASMDEAYIIMRECRTKLEIHENADYVRLKCTPHSDAANRRQLDKLRTYLLANENDFKQLHEILEQQWCEYQDVVRRNSKHEMHMPCLDGVYQKMSKIKNLLTLHRQKLQYIKNKLKASRILYKPPHQPNMNRKAANALVRGANKKMETLTDSMLSMSLTQMVTQSRAQLTTKKLQAIHNFTKQQKEINVIRPKRPDRVGLKSEVILEIKLQTNRKQKPVKVKRGDTNKMELNSQQQQLQQEQQLQQQTQQQQHVSVKPHSKLSAHSSNLTKPQASKPIPTTMSANMFNTPSVASSAYTNLNISSSSSFVKTSSGAMNDQTLIKPPLANTTLFAGFTTGGSATFNFSQQPNKSNKDAAPTPVSFNAKVLQSNEMKISATATTSALTKTTTNQNVTNKMNGGTANMKQQPQESNQPMIFTKTATTHSLGGSAAATTTPLASFQLSKSTPCATLAPAAASTVAAFNFNGSSNRNADSSAVVSPSNSFTDFLHIGSKQAGVDPKSKATTSLSNFAPSPSATFGNVANGSKGGGGPMSSFFALASSTANAQSKTAANATTTMSTKTTLKPIDLTSSIDFSGAEIELGPLTICKPTTKENDGNAKSVKSTTAPTTMSTAAVPSPFSFINAAAEDSGQGKSVFGASINSTAGTPASSAFSFSIAAAGANSMTATKTTASITKSTAAPAPLSTATTATSVFNSVTTTASVAPMFGALNLATAATGSVVNTTPTTTAPSGNIFGGASNIFSTTTTKTTTATTSTFAQSTNIFGGGGSGGTTVPTTSANIFKGIPKPDQSIFGGGVSGGSDCVANTAPASNAANVPSGLFAAAAVSTKPLTNAGENIFGGDSGGGGNVAFNSPLGTGGGSIFGGSNSTPATAGPFVSAAGGSLFGNQAKSPTESGNIFNSATQPQQQANAPGGGSLFGKSTFGQSTNANVFGGQAQASAATGGGFGAGAASSIFGGGVGGGSAVSGGSLFGGSATPPAFGSTASSFGSFSQPTASTSAFGSPTGFAQGGTTSVQQSGFGSPTQQPSSAFAKPVFGGPPTFGNPTPAFGAQATFGGAPTFGSPKGFGSFAASTGSATSPVGAAAAAVGDGGLGFGGTASAPTKGNIFETLGSSDSGISFGNLAQTTQQPAPPKPTFGGSSFMNYRS